MKNYRYKRITIPFGLSLCIHAVLLSVFVWIGLSTFSPPAGDDASGDDKPTTVQEDLDEATDTIKDRIDEGLEEASAATDAENLQRTDAAATFLENNSSEESVEAIGKKVAAIYGTNDRAYKPVFPRPAGSFHYKSMVEYSREKRIDDDGIERSHRTWVDQDGRTMVQTSRDFVDDDGKKWTMTGTYQPDGTLYESKMRYDPSLAARDQALDRISKSPLMRKLLSEAILPVLEAKRREQERKVTPGSPRSPKATDPGR